MSDEERENLKPKHSVQEGMWGIGGGPGFKFSKVLLLVCWSLKCWDWNEQPSAFLLLDSFASLCTPCPLLEITGYFRVAASVRLIEEVWQELDSPVIRAFSWDMGARGVNSSCRKYFCRSSSVVVAPKYSVAGDGDLGFGRWRINKANLHWIQVRCLISSICSVICLVFYSSLRGFVSQVDKDLRSVHFGHSWFSQGVAGNSWVGQECQSPFWGLPYGILLKVMQIYDYYYYLLLICVVQHIRLGTRFLTGWLRILPVWIM